MRRAGGPVTLLNCDNLRHNGERFRGGLLQFIDAAGRRRAAATGCSANTSSPNAMVDRITPRPPPEVAERVKARHRLGRRRAGDGRELHPVGDRGRLLQRPPGVGARRRRDGRRRSQPYEEAKIRILNASHSGIAWAGTLARLSVHPRRHARCRRSAQIAYDYVTDDVIPCLDTPGASRARSTSPPTATSCSSASAIPPSATPTSASRWTASRRSPASSRRPCASAWRAAQSIASVAMLPALFLAFLQRWHRGELPYAYQDQAMDPARRTRSAPRADPVAAFCRDPCCGVRSPAIPVWSRRCAQRSERVADLRAGARR